MMNSTNTGESINSSSVEIMGEIITEIRSGGAHDKEHQDADPNSDVYMAALNSLMNSSNTIREVKHENATSIRQDNKLDQHESLVTSSHDDLNRDSTLHSVNGSSPLIDDNQKICDMFTNNDAGTEPYNQMHRDEYPPNSHSATESVQEYLPVHIGGPNTCLPFFVESSLGWSLCLSCLFVSGYHYVKSVLLPTTNWYMILRQKVHRLVSGRWQLGYDCNDRHLSLDANDFTEKPKWIPLTTCTRDELNRNSPWKSYLSLVRLLEKEYPETLVPLVALESDPAKLDGQSDAFTSLAAMNDATENQESYSMLTEKADIQLIRVLRHDDVCRRLASLAMRPHDVCIQTTVTTITKTVSIVTPATVTASTESHTITAPAKSCSNTSCIKTTSTMLKQLPHNHLLQRLSNIWNELLALPTLEESKSFYRIPTTDSHTVEKKYRDNDAYHAYKISLILPAFREKGSHMQAKLNKALVMASSPEEVEVIVVDAGGCTDLEMILEEQPKFKSEVKNSKQWGRICIVTFSSGGGRGPCMNYGANSATGRILTFCHSDTSLPIRWDARIVKTLEYDNKDEYDVNREGIARVNSCSFTFGIDTSPEGLSMPFISSLTSYFPPGLRAVETTANLRSHLYSLPYGDSTLSMHASVFHFLGGYPDQCLMEDYEFVSLLRLRAALLRQTPFYGTEKLAIMRGQPALCSPRRWQKFGVLYVTYMNSRLVNLYAGSMSADDLFRRYYGQEPPKRQSNFSPWEIELNNRLNGDH